jgi:DNA-binding MarR family transcriptional regulator
MSEQEATVVDRTKTAEDIVNGFRAVNRATDRQMLPMLVELGLTMAQFKALIAVMSAGPEGISVTELSHELSVGQPSASLIVDQIEKAGYAARVTDVADRRRVLVRGTDHGMEVTAELRGGRASVFREWLAQVSDEDAESLARGFRALAAIVQASPLGRPLR